MNFKAILLSGVITSGVPALRTFGAETHYLMTSDTYLDNYAFPNTPVNNAINNYGNVGVIKAVSNHGTDSLYGGYNSLVHALFTIDSAFFADSTLKGLVPGNHVYVNYFLKTDMLNPAGEAKSFTRGLQVAPLTHTFDEGTGGATNQTNNSYGTNSDTARVGADWNTYDGLGTHTWNSVAGTHAADGGGGAFDQDAFAPATMTVVDGKAAVQMDITSWFTSVDPTARIEAAANGLMLEVTQEGNYVGNDFVSLFSRNSTVTGTPAPTVPYAVIQLPEPGAAMTAVAGASLLAMRWRRQRTGAIYN